MGKWQGSLLLVRVTARVASGGEWALDLVPTLSFALLFKQYS
jgi:hypothetical protein